MKFNGDIIITDPGYVIKDEDWDEFLDDYAWAAGRAEDVNFKGLNLMYSNTLYGDWSCNTFEKETNNILGEFCADAGLVAVFLLDEVLKYNPNFNYHKERTWTTTWIKNFDGEVSFVVNDCEELEVHGSGNVNFIGKQTGF